MEQSQVKLFLEYKEAPTKVLEFVINSSRVSQLICDYQFEYPDLLEEFLSIMDDVKLETEEGAEKALLKLSKFVHFHKGVC